MSFWKLLGVMALSRWFDIRKKAYKEQDRTGNEADLQRKKILEEIIKTLYGRSFNL